MGWNSVCVALVLAVTSAFAGVEEELARLASLSTVCLENSTEEYCSRYFGAMIETLSEMSTAEETAAVIHKIGDHLDQIVFLEECAPRKLATLTALDSLEVIERRVGSRCMKEIQKLVSLCRNGHYRHENPSDLPLIPEVFSHFYVLSLIREAFLSEEWALETMVSVNKILEQNSIDSEVRQKFSNDLVAWVGDHFQLSDKIAYELPSALAKVNANKKHTMQSYLAAVLQVALTKLRAEDDLAEELAVEVDSIFLKALPLSVKEELSRMALCFAKIEDQENDTLYACLCLNPRTEEISFGTLTREGGISFVK